MDVLIEVELFGMVLRSLAKPMNVEENVACI